MAAISSTGRVSSHMTATAAKISAFVSVRDLILQSDSPSPPKVFDTSWHMDPARNGKREFEAQRIPGAYFFDINEVADQASTLPHMFPNADVQHAAEQHFGLSRSQPIVVYEAGATFSAPRAWWTFKQMGFDAKILSGGMQEWIAAGARVDHEPCEVPKLEVASGSAPLVSKKPAGIVGFEAMQATSKACHTARSERQRGSPLQSDWILDARAAGRFNGSSPEPRQGVQSGHMPGSHNVPFNLLLNAQTGQMLSPDELRAVFDKCGVQVGQSARYTTTCGSGVTAAVVLLALFECGVPWENLQLYDGSWLEWATRGGEVLRA